MIQPHGTFRRRAHLNSLLHKPEPQKLLSAVKSSVDAALHEPETEDRIATVKDEVSKFIHFEQHPAVYVGLIGLNIAIFFACKLCYTTPAESTGSEGFAPMSAQSQPAIEVFERAIHPQVKPSVNWTQTVEGQKSADVQNASFAGLAEAAPVYVAPRAGSHFPPPPPVMTIQGASKHKNTAGPFLVPPPPPLLPGTEIGEWSNNSLAGLPTPVAGMSFDTPTASPFRPTGVRVRSHGFQRARQTVVSR